MPSPSWFARHGGSWYTCVVAVPRPAAWWAPRGLTVRLATTADRPALARLAGLDEAPAPSGPVLLGVVMQRPVAALSLSDGRVLADPFTPTADLIELLRLRARQLGLRR